MISPNDFKTESERIRQYSPFISDHIYVWSNRQVKFWQKSGLDKNNITVIGQPRSDLFYSEKTDNIDTLFGCKRPLITFFTYEDSAYIPLALAQTEGLSWKNMKQETQDFLYLQAKIHPEYNFIFKAHPQQTDLKILQNHYTLPNLKVIGGSSTANELIIRSELIIAFQTTAVLEAMFMEKRLIYTNWDKTIHRVSSDIIPYHCAKGVVISNAYPSFKEVCERFLSGNNSDFNFTNDDIKEKHRLVSHYLYKPDGHVSERFFNEIEKIL